MRAVDVWTDEMFSDEITGDVVSDAVYNRNRKVQERFNVNFSLITASDDLAVDGMNSILAGDDAYDLIDPHAQASFSYANMRACS